MYLIVICDYVFVRVMYNESYLSVKFVYIPCDVLNYKIKTRNSICIFNPQSASIVYETFWERIKKELQSRTK